MLGNPPFLVGADAAVENHPLLLDANADVVDVERVVGGEVVADDLAQLVVAQVVQIVDVFEIAGHGSSSSRSRRAGIALRRERRVSC